MAFEILRQGVTLDKANNVFKLCTTKKEDSYIMDFLHENSVIFGQVRAAVLNDPNENYCPFCYKE